MKTTTCKECLRFRYFASGGGYTFYQILSVLHWFWNLASLLLRTSSCSLPLAPPSLASSSIFLMISSSSPATGAGATDSAAAESDAGLTLGLAPVSGAGVADVEGVVLVTEDKDGVVVVDAADEADDEVVVVVVLEAVFVLLRFRAPTTLEYCCISITAASRSTWEIKNKNSKVNSHICLSPIAVPAHLDIP